jgi:hypothetical protein
MLVASASIWMTARIQCADTAKRSEASYDFRKPIG